MASVAFDVLYRALCEDHLVVSVVQRRRPRHGRARDVCALGVVEVDVAALALGGQVPWECGARRKSPT
jgi:hypothetical protein